MALSDWTPEELARFDENEKQRRQKRRQSCRNYQTELRHAALRKLGGKCAECGDEDFSTLQIDEHDKTLSWSKRYRAILNGAMYRLLCAKCNWKKRQINQEATGRPRLLD